MIHVDFGCACFHSHLEPGDEVVRSPVDCHSGSLVVHERQQTTGSLSLLVFTSPPYASTTTTKCGTISRCYSAPASASPRPSSSLLALATQPDLLSVAPPSPDATPSLYPDIGIGNCSKPVSSTRSHIFQGECGTTGAAKALIVDIGGTI